MRHTPNTPLYQAGSPAGLVRRLLLLECVKHPRSACSSGSRLLSPRLKPAWQQQQLLDLQHITLAGPGASGPDGQAVRTSGWPEGWQQGWHPALSSLLLCSTVLAGREGQPSGELVVALLAQLGRQVGCTGFGGQEVDDELAKYAASCTGLLCRAALCAWVLTWHAAMEEAGGDYGSAQAR